MNNRLELHEKLCDILGSRNVYYQPPESLKINYPCIVYEKDDIRFSHADNKIYLKTNRYSITLIGKQVDNPVADKILENFEYCSFNRSFKNDNLYHDVFVLYY